MAPPASHALHSLLRAARPLPLPLRRKLVSNLRDLAGLGLGGRPSDAENAARLVSWVVRLPEVREERERGSASRSWEPDHLPHAHAE